MITEIQKIVIIFLNQSLIFSQTKEQLWLAYDLCVKEDAREMQMYGVDNFLGRNELSTSIT